MLDNAPMIKPGLREQEEKQMGRNVRNMRVMSFILLVAGLFLPMISIKFLGVSQSISLFELVTNIQSLSFLGDVNNLIAAVYVIFLVYLISIVTNGLAIFNNNRKITVISGITALVYSVIIFLGVIAAKSELSSSANDPFSRAIGSAAASMFNVDIGVGAAFLASLLLFGSLMVKER